MVVVGVARLDGVVPAAQGWAPIELEEGEASGEGSRKRRRPAVSERKERRQRWWWCGVRAQRQWWYEEDGRDKVL